MKRCLLYIPVETKARELLAKAFLAAKAVERGWIVLLGRQKEVFKAASEGLAGAFVINGIPDYHTDLLKKYQGKGHRIVDLCEENTVYTDGLDYCQRKIGTHVLKHVNLLLVSGLWNADHIRQYRPAGSDKIRITGNPRFDTLMPELRAVYEEPSRNISDEFGNFLLVNTNFGSSNPFTRGQDRIEYLAKRGKLGGDQHSAQIRRWVEYKTRHLDQLKIMLAEVSASGRFDRIVVRPHPSEDHVMWRQWGASRGMDVQFRGSANEWMLAADAILHTGCTTGLEGVMLDRPVASFVLEGETEFLNCTDEVSYKVKSADEFLRRVDEWRMWPAEERRERLAPFRDLAQSYICNVEPPYAADRILDALDELDLPNHPADVVASHWGVTFKSRLLLSAARSSLRSLRQGPGANSQKFPDLLLEEMKSPLERWKASGVLTGIPSFKPVGRMVWLLT